MLCSCDIKTRPVVPENSEIRYGVMNLPPPTPNTLTSVAEGCSVEVGGGGMVLWPATCVPLSHLDAAARQSGWRRAGDSANRRRPGSGCQGRGGGVRRSDWIGCSLVALGAGIRLIGGCEIVLWSTDPLAACVFVCVMMGTVLHIQSVRSKIRLSSSICVYCTVDHRKTC